MFEIYLIDKAKENIGNISRLFKEITNLEITKTSIELEDLKKILHTMKPLIVLLGTSYTIEDIETILKSGFNSDLIKIVLLVRTNSVLILKKALDLGIYDIIEFPFDKENINKTIRRADIFFKSKNVESFPPPEGYKKVWEKRIKKNNDFQHEGRNRKIILSSKSCNRSV